MYLIVGLGNPGDQYRSSRHNIGFMVLDTLAGESGVRPRGGGFQSRYARTTWEGRSLVFLWPMTFMNNSGMSVRAAADYYRVDIGDVIVVHDDLDLPPGRLKVVRGGGAAGHKGVLSVKRHLGSSEFPRIKVGIGRPRFGEAVEDYVLRPCYEDEKEAFSKAVAAAAGACRVVVRDGVEAAMNLFNRKNLSKEEVSD